MGGAKPKRSDNHARMLLSLALPPKGAGQHRHGGRNIQFPPRPRPSGYTHQTEILRSRRYINLLVLGVISASRGSSPVGTTESSQLGAIHNK